MSEVVLTILNEIAKGNLVKASDYSSFGLAPEDYWETVETLQKNGLIKGVEVVRRGRENQIIHTDMEKARLTLRGLECLNLAKNKLTNT